MRSADPCDCWPDERPARLAGSIHQAADPQAELVADFDDLALGDRAVANGELQRLIARLVELDDRARTEFDDFLNALALRGQRHLHRHANLQQAAGERRQAGPARPRSADSRRRRLRQAASAAGRGSGFGRGFQVSIRPWISLRLEPLSAHEHVCLIDQS